MPVRNVHGALNILKKGEKHIGCATVAEVLCTMLWNQSDEVVSYTIPIRWSDKKFSEQEKQANARNKHHTFTSKNDGGGNCTGL